MFPAIPDQAEHRDQRREIRLHRQPPVPQKRPQEQFADRFLPELGRFMRFARSRPRLSSADLHIVRARRRSAFRLIVMVRQCRHVR
jgi:hypothetical protein